MWWKKKQSAGVQGKLACACYSSATAVQTAENPNFTQWKLSEHKVHHSLLRMEVCSHSVSMLTLSNAPCSQWGCVNQNWTGSGRKIAWSHDAYHYCAHPGACVVARGSSSLGRRQAKAVWYSGLLWLVVPVSDRGGLKQPNSAMCAINGCEPHQGYFKKANDHLLVFSTPEGWLLNNKQRNGEDMFLHRLTPHLVSVLNSSG